MTPRPPPSIPRWLQPFQRITSGAAHIREVDGLRCVALLAVLFLHLNHFVVLDSAVPLSPDPAHSSFNRWLESGSYGVQLFFAISGFILGLPFLRHYTLGGARIDLKKYFLRRLTRLEPPLIINLTLLAALMVFVLHRSWEHLWPHYLATCFYLHSTWFGEVSRINSVTWSLEVEVQFYILMPVLAQMFRIPSFVQRQMVMTGLLLFFGLTSFNHGKAFLTEQMEYFLVADWWLQTDPEKRLDPRYDLLSLAAWPALALAVFWHKDIPGAGALVPLLMAAVFIGALRGPAASRLFSATWPVTLGGMCYTAYLYHLPVMSALSDRLSPHLAADSHLQRFMVYSMVILPAVVLVSMVFFLLFEKPFMAWSPWKKRASAAKEPALARE